MHGFSTIDGFIEVNECVGDMIKYLANEPSVGLFFIQHHCQSAAPNLLALKDKIVEKSNEMALQTEDLEDSIAMVESMNECGFSIADDMNKDIKRSILIMSRSQPKRGLINSPSLGFQIGRSGSWRPLAFTYGTGHSQSDSESGGGGGGYLSTVLNSARQKAATIRWPQLDVSQSKNPKGERLVSSPTLPEPVVASSGAVSTMLDMDAVELPLSSQIDDGPLDLSTTDGEGLPSQDPSLRPEDFEKFRSDQEAKLKEWLEETEDRNGCKNAS